MISRVGRSRGQTLVEYAILIALTAATLTAMYGFIRSSLSHKLKTGADGIGQGMLYGGP